MKIAKIVGALIILSFGSAQAQKQDTLCIVAINDFHGAFLPSAQCPGANALLWMIDSLKQVWPNMLVVSAGDNFGGSYFSNASKGELIPNLFNALNVSISAIGNHEFDQGQEFLADQWSHSKPQDWTFQYLSANIFTDDGKRPPWLKPYSTINLNLPNVGTMRIAFVGLTTANTPNQVDRSTIQGLRFDPNYRSILNDLQKETNLAKADLRILLTHIGTEMMNDTVTWTESGDAQRLPDLYPLYAGIFTGHSHKIVCGRLRGMPIVQANINATHLSVLRYVFHRNAKTVEVETLEPLVIPVEGSQNMADKIQNVLDNPEMGLRDVLAQTDNDLIHQRNDKLKFTDLGAYVTAAFADAYRQKSSDTSLVIACVHFGSIRNNVLKGDITKLIAGEVLPFGSELLAYRFTGESFKELIQMGINNERYGFLQSHQLRIGRQDIGGQSIVTYIDYQGDTLQCIEDTTELIVVVDAYIASGNDGYNAALFPEPMRIPIQLPNSTDAFMNFLKKIRHLSTDSSLLPRLVTTY